MNQNRRRNLREMEKQGFSYVFTQEEKDFDLFYHRMYRPYIHQRYGKRAMQHEYESLRRQFERGGMILVRCNQELICGMLCLKVGDTCEAHQMGVHEDHFDQVEKGASVALWWFMMDWARRNGLSYFDFGASRARTADGTFNFKRQWGTRVVPERDVHTEWVFYSDGLSPRLRHHLNKQGFISQIEGWHYHVVLPGPGEGLTGAELSGELKRAAKYGLNGVLFISPQTGSVEMFHTRQLAVEEAV
jgi:hypothetical protein